MADNSDRWSYFIGKGEQAVALIKDCHGKIEAMAAARRELMAEYGATGLYAHSQGYDNPCWIVFDNKISDEDVKWLKLVKETDGKFAYKPMKNTKKGKELYNRMCHPSLAFNPSDYLVKQLGIDRSRITSGYMLMSVAWYIDDIILAKIPGFPPDPHDADKPHYGDKWPEHIPDWLMPVKYSEFLAAQGR